MLRIVYCDQPAGCSVADLVNRVKKDEEGVVDVVGGACYVGCLDYALHVCRTRGHFRRKLLLAPVDLDFVLRKESMTSAQFSIKCFLLSLMGMCNEIKKYFRVCDAVCVFFLPLILYFYFAR